MSCSRRAIGECQILLGTFLFGVSFVASKYAMDINIGPLSFNAWQHIVASLMLLISRTSIKRAVKTLSDDVDTNSESDVIVVLRRVLPRQLTECKDFELWTWGVICGSTNFAGSVCTQIGLVSISAGKSAFLTGLYVVVTPIIESCLPGSRNVVSKFEWLAVAISVVGTYLLSGCMEESSGSCLSHFQGGELVTLLGMIIWSFSIISSDSGAKRVDCIDLSTIEMFVSTFLCLLVALVWESERLWDVLQMPLIAWAIIALVGFNDAAAYVTETLGQMYTTAARAALFMSIDAVVAAVLGFLCLAEQLSWTEIGGCILMFTATVIATAEFEDDPGLDSPKLNKRGRHAYRHRRHSFSVSDLSTHTTLPNRDAAGNRIRYHTFDGEDTSALETKPFVGSIMSNFQSSH